MIHVSETNDLAGLEQIRLVWDSLWRRSRQACYSQSFDWFAVWCRHAGPAVTPRPLLVTVAARPIGILPLVVRRTQTAVGPVRVLSYPQGQTGASRPVGPNSAATLIAAMRYLRDNRRDWDVIDLDGIDLNRLDRGRTSNAMRSAGMKFVSQFSQAAGCVAELEPDWTTFWSEQRVESRRRFHEAERRLKQRGRVEFLRFRPEEREYGDAECRWDLFDEFAQLCDESTAESPGSAAFLRDVHGCAARQAAVDLSLLRIDGRAVAAAYGYVVDGQVELIRCGGADGDREDALRVLGARMLQDGASRGDRCYRFAPQMRSLISAWHASEVRTERLTHFAPTAPKAQLLRWNRNVRNWWDAIRRTAAALNL